MKIITLLVALFWMILLKTGFAHTAFIFPFVARFARTSVTKARAL
jgi:hypothetical protein